MTFYEKAKQTYVIDVTEHFFGVVVNAKLAKRYVLDPKLSTDFSWSTRDLSRAKRYKTRRGAQRWLNERSNIKGKVVTEWDAIQESLGK